MTHEVMTKFSLQGKKGKLAFDRCRLYPIVTGEFHCQSPRQHDARHLINFCLFITSSMLMKYCQVM
jgi:hypothetical protein